jgi:hypothetical protein
MTEREVLDGSCSAQIDIKGLAAKPSTKIGGQGIGAIPVEVACCKVPTKLAISKGNEELRRRPMREPPVQLVPDPRRGDSGQDCGLQTVLCHGVATFLSPRLRIVAPPGQV